MAEIIAALKAVNFKAVFEAVLAMIVDTVKEIFNAEVPEFSETK